MPVGEKIAIVLPSIILIMVGTRIGDGIMAGIVGDGTVGIIGAGTVGVGITGGITTHFGVHPTTAAITIAGPITDRTDIMAVITATHTDHGIMDPTIIITAQGLPTVQVDEGAMLPIEERLVSLVPLA